MTYKPSFNRVLVEIDDKEAIWGKGTDTNLGGEVYREGKVLQVGECIQTSDYPDYPDEDDMNALVGKNIMWNEGHEAGTVFEENGKKYALIYWFDITGVQDDK